LLVSLWLGTTLGRLLGWLRTSTSLASNWLLTIQAINQCSIGLCIQSDTVARDGDCALDLGLVGWVALVLGELGDADGWEALYGDFVVAELGDGWWW